jgi:hypothetical protein
VVDICDGLQFHLNGFLLNVDILEGLENLFIMNFCFVQL